MKPPSIPVVLRGFVIALILGVELAVAGTVATIKPGAIWPDDRGEHINAHGGGILKVGDTWYWFGEYRPKEAVPGRRHVSCYSSTDLVNWKFRGLPIDMTAPEGFGPNWVLERPKVFYNAKTKKFVMYVHLDGPLDPNEPDPNKAYKLARVGVAVSDTVAGPYQYLRSFRPLGQESRDIGQFIDDDGSAYLIFESRPTKGFFIAKLSDDYLDVVEETAFLQAPIEGGALVHHDGLYYILGSALTGWRPNPNKYATAKELKGPWSEFKDIAPPQTNTYQSQSTLLVKVVGTEQTTVIFMGDQWKPKAQWDSRYLWMPLEIGGGRLWLPEPREWTLDAKTGATVILPGAAPGQNASGGFVSIETQGAVGDGKTLNTEKIQATIDRLAASGGGTLVVPPGTFLSGALFLKPGVNLQLEKGAVLKCSTDMANFPTGRTRIEGHFEENWSPALINADGCDGLRITGEGTLDGDGQPLWDHFWKLRNASPDPRTFVSLSVRRARLCFIQNSKDVAVSGITFKDSQFWNLHLYNCQDVVVENSRFEIPDAGSGPSTDGIDIDSSQNVIVRSCYFSVNDDAVCLKGTRYPGLNQEPKSPPVRNVVVENCTFVRGHGALTLGTEAQGISEVEMTDCVVRGKMPMLRLKLRPDTPNQDYRNIRIRNIRLEGGEGQIVHVYGYYGTGVPSPGELVGVQGATPKAPISKVSDIVIENITGTFGTFGSLSGGTTATVSGVTFRNINVTVTGSAELNTEGATEVKFENVLVQKTQKL
jgi:polygalacturonase